MAKKEEIEFDSHGLDIGTVLYYARIMPNCDTYEILEIKVRTLKPEYFVGSEKYTKQAFLFNYDALGTIVFKSRDDALLIVKAAESM